MASNGGGVSGTPSRPHENDLVKAVRGEITTEEYVSRVKARSHAYVNSIPRQPTFDEFDVSAALVFGVFMGLVIGSFVASMLWWALA